MAVSFYATIVSTISHEWTGVPGSPNHQNIAEFPMIENYTIDNRSYNIDKRETMDVYGVSLIPPLPWNATDIMLQVGARMRTTHHFGWFYAHVSLYNGEDNWVTLRKVLDPHQWTSVSSELFHLTHPEVVAINQIKLQADTNPIEVSALYLYIEYVLGDYIKYGTGKIYGTGWTYGLNPI